MVPVFLVKFIDGVGNVLKSDVMFLATASGTNAYPPSDIQQKRHHRGITRTADLLCDQLLVAMRAVKPGYLTFRDLNIRLMIVTSINGT